MPAGIRGRRAMQRFRKNEGPVASAAQVGAGFRNCF